MRNKSKKIWIVLAAISLLIFDTGICQNKSKRPKLGLGFELGQWVPTNLNSEPDLSSLIAIKNRPYLGVMLLKPLGYDFTFRGGANVWKYYEEDASTTKKSIQIASLLFDIKYTLLADVFIQPYVSYGAGLFFGFDNKNNNAFINFKGDSEMGIGFNVGTGFDFQLTNNLSLELEFRYHYVKFSNVVQFTDNYSGPKISIAALYFF